MMRSKTMTALLLAGLVALPMVAAQDSATNDDEAARGTATFLSATLEDLVLELPGRDRATVELVLQRGGEELARESRGLTLSGGAASLEGITASVRTDETPFTAHTLTANIVVDNDSMLRLAGQPQETTSGTLEFRVSQVSWPSESAIHLDGPKLVTFKRGWSSDEITVAFAPAEDADLANASVRMEAWADATQDEGEDVLVFEDVRGVSLSEDGNRYAVFDLDHLPPTLTWRATLVREQTSLASLWGEVDFPSGKSWDSGFDPGKPAQVEAAAGLHDVEDHSDSVTLPSSLLTSTFPVTREDESGQGFNRVEGRNPGALGEFFEEPEAAPAATAGTADAPADEATGTDDGGSVTVACSGDACASLTDELPKRLLLILGGAAVLLGLAVAVLARRSRSGVRR